MMDMSIPYEETGRRGQKERTREALLAATRDLLAEGVTPNVEEGAAGASVSRTTAYRYFPNQRALLAAAHPEIEARSLIGPHAPPEASERFELLVEALTSTVVENEAQLRATLWLALDPADGDRDQLVLRQGRAIGWIEDALAPLKGGVPAEAIRRLTLATRASCGIESLVWLTDVAGLSREEAVELMRWSARSLYEATLRTPA